jgi:putative restriction endonuclease
LLDAAHIAADAEPEGAPQISNGLSLCSIHHRAFDHNLVGVSPDYRVHISEHLLEDEDGPMLEVLKVADGVRSSFLAKRSGGRIRSSWRNASPALARPSRNQESLARQ